MRNEQKIAKIKKIRETNILKKVIDNLKRQKALKKTKTRNIIVVSETQFLENCV